MTTNFKVGDRVTSEYHHSNILISLFCGGHLAALKYNEKCTLPQSYWVSNSRLIKINPTLTTLWDI